MRDKQREETRRRVYLAALEVFRRDGFSTCRIDDIAKRAEVSRAAFYFHFPSKEDVLLEMVREARAPIVERPEALPGQASPVEVPDVLAESMGEVWQREQVLLVDALTTTLRYQTTVMHDREAEPVRARLTTRFIAAAERGELSSVVAPEVLTDFFLVNCLASMLAWRGTKMELPLSVVLKGVTQLFLTGAAGSRAKAS